MKKHIYVSAAVMKNSEEKVLIAQRPKGSDMELLWEFPGGKIECGETPQVALQRELKEELNIDAKCTEIVYEETFDYPDKIVTLYFVKVDSFKGTIEALEHEQIVWITTSEFCNYSFPPADDDFIKILINECKC